MKKIILLFGLIFSYFAFSQGENNNWYFGKYAGVTFNTNPPSALTGSAMLMEEGVATISRPNGELLFYTNGVDIWNREHQIMTNGTGLTGHQSTQQVLILPHLGNINQYYVFTMSEFQQPVITNISYSIVDVSLGGLGIDGKPLGAVTNDKNIALKNETGQPLTYPTEAITSVLHSDNQSYWVLIPNGTKLYSYRLDSNGFDNDNPETSDLEFSIGTTAEIKASPNLSPNLGVPYTNLVSISFWSNAIGVVHVYSFDNNTGKLSLNNDTGDYDYFLEFSDYIDGDPLPLSFYSTEFSHSGTILYTVRFYDAAISAIDLFSTPVNVNPLVPVGWYLPGAYPYGTLQRAVDNNIYFSLNGSGSLLKINNSDSFTNASINLYSSNNIGLGALKSSQRGLPQLIPLFCKENLILDSPEVSYSMLYEISNNITTHENYMAGTDKDIMLSAGNMVEILPDSHIESGSVFRAMIEGCSNSVANRKSMAKNRKPVRATIIDNFGKEEVADLKIYPNPVKDVINLSNTAVIDNVIITDMNGRVVKNVTLGVNEGQINISDLSQGVYILNATSNGKSFTKKIVKQ